MKSLSIAFINDSTTINDRIFHSIYVIHFTRLWRQWLKNNEISADHFISRNAYDGMELNTIFIVSLIQSKKLHLISLMSSQTCESFFRMLRSYTGVENLVANCSIKGFVSRVQRLQLEDILMRSFQTDINFPRLKKEANTTNVQYPSNDEIEKTMMKAMKLAEKNADKLGMKNVILTDLHNFVTSDSQADREISSSDIGETEMDINNEFVDDVTDVVGEFEDVFDSMEIDQLILDNQPTG
jgi:hypothetical protein